MSYIYVYSKKKLTKHLHKTSNGDININFVDKIECFLWDVKVRVLNEAVNKLFYKFIASYKWPSYLQKGAINKWF